MSAFAALRWPDPAGQHALIAAAVTWVAVLGGRWFVAQPVPALGVAMLLGIGVLAATPRQVSIVVLMIGGVVAGLAYQTRVERVLELEVPSGPVVLTGVLRSDVADSVGLVAAERSSAGAWDRVPLLVRVDEPFAAGTRVTLAGMLSDRGGLWRGEPYAATLDAHRVVDVAGPASRLHGLADTIRARVTQTFPGQAPGQGLVRGFLTGDTANVDPRVLEAMRGSGLSHYVAVSGSNVALFLLLLWVAAGPLSFDVRSRALVGLAGLVVFVLVTRWEPSVLRAAVMAAALLVARAVGYPLSVWASLGAAVTGLVLVAPQLTTAAGFHLSVAATLGVMASADLFPSISFGPARRALSASVGAQIAVAPLLAAWFGSVPIAAPLANLVAAPLVAGATLTGTAAAMSGWSRLGVIASTLAQLVEAIAEYASQAPAAGPVVVAAALVALATPARKARHGLVAVVLACAFVPSFGRGLDGPAVVFLDIGQGDAALINTENGGWILIDGGPDPGLLHAKLERFRVRRLDLVVISHPHEDHVAGLRAVIGQRPVGMVWHPGYSDPGQTFDDLTELAVEHGIPMTVPNPGRSFEVDGIRLEVIGPLRRYDSANDQSLVLRVSTGQVSVLLPGDVEKVAQRELGPLPADVMKVPHQGAATSELDWLRESKPRLAIVSVGPNQFGHPSQFVLEALQQAGATVVRTDQVGDVRVPLDEPMVHVE